MRSKLLSWSRIASVVVVAACSDLPPEPTSKVRARAGELQAVRKEKSGPIPGQWVIELTRSAPDKRGEMARLLRAANGRLKSDHIDVARAFVAYMSEPAALALRNHPSVASVMPNMTARLVTTQSQPGWALDRLDARNLPNNGQYSYGLRGHGTHIYIIDTGIDAQHVDFGNRATADVSMAGDNNPSVDGVGHGTAMASLAGGNLYGIAKGARLHGVKVIDMYGLGDISSVVNGVDWVRLNHIKPAVANISLGFDVQVPALTNALQSLVDAGVAVTIAAGNDFEDSCLSSPSDFTGGLVVAAVDSFDTRTAYSNVGTCVDLYAPGEGVWSAWYDYWGAPADHNDGAVIFGTSASAPLTAGTAAIYLESNPTATAAQVHDQIINDATAGVVVGPGLGTPNRLLYAPYRNPPPLFVTLTGPSSVKPMANCTWFSNVSGGTPPYAYLWLPTWQTGTEMNFTNQGNAFTAQLQVWDAYQVVVKSKNVSISSSAPICFQ